MEPTLVVIGLSHHTAGVEVRERFWMSGCRQAEALSMLAQAEGIEEVLVFSTCNRTEFVAWGDPTLAVNSVLRFLTAEYDLKLCEWNSFYRLLDEQALEHAFRVSCGLDARCIGEPHIARQVNQAWQLARNAGSAGRYLDAVLRQAVAVRRRVRKETAVHPSFASAAQAAIEFAEETFGSLTGRNVVVLGAGTMGEAVARAFQARHAQPVCVINRTDSRAEALAQKLGIQTHAFEQRRARLAQADLVISATASPTFVITPEDMRQVAAIRGSGRFVLIDLALPRDIDPRVREFEGVLLYDLEDLERAVEPRELVHDGETKAEAIVAASAQGFRKELKAEGVPAAVSELRRRLDELCRQELESFRLEQGPFPKDQDQLITAVSARISHRIAGSLAKELKHHEIRKPGGLPAAV